MVVTDAVVVKVDSVETEESVHKESDQRVETVAPVKPGRGHSVHKGHANHVHRESDRRVRKESGDRGKAESDRHVRRESEAHGLSRLQLLKQLLRRRQPFSQRQSSRRHQWNRSCRQQRRLRASRGDSKPCYWHRHVQSTADSIAVA